MRPSLTSAVALGLLAGMAALAVPAQAGPITYTFTGTVSGNVSGTAFTNSLLTLTAVGDTTSVTQAGSVFRNSVGPITFTLTGVGAGTSLNSFTVFDNQTNGIAGLTDQTTTFDVFDESSPSFTTYDLRSSLGPLPTGFPFTSTLRPLQTTLGAITISSSSNDTFTASPPAVPEASTTVSLGLLLALGMGGMVVTAKKRKRA